ncbi:MAG: dihydrolipoyl dehydrogenase [Planctomycetota bacterium]|nr:MAG: dihydrolipoyl dehydrogenase [Planctomycetota bacterium]
METQLVVLGGGPGGYSAAFMAADLGMEVTMIEAKPKLGGTCLIEGCIPSKALLHVARVVSETREMGEWGVDYQPPTVDVDAMRARKDKVIGNLSSGLAQLAKRRKVKVIHARASFLDSQTLKLEGGDPDTYEDDKLAFEHCILASGSVPAMPRAFRLKTDRVMDSSGALALPDVPESLLVVGGGYIGLELGTVYAELGTEVTVVELTPTLLPTADRDLVKPLEDRLKKIFTAILLNTKVAGMSEAKDGVDVQFEDENGKRTEKFSRVLVSVGRAPNSKGIGLENTNVELDEKGFVVIDERQFTADEHISAIGDVAGEPMLAHKAMHEGKVAVEALLGEPAAFEPMAIPAVVFTDPEIAWAGLTEQEAKAQGVDYEVVKYPWAASGRALALGRTEGLTKMLIDPESERILGIGIVGVSAGDIITEAVMAIEMGATARDMAESIHPHPTLSETLGNAAEVFLGTATEIYKPRPARKA